MLFEFTAGLCVLWPRDELADDEQQHSHFMEFAKLRFYKTKMFFFLATYNNSHCTINTKKTLKLLFDN